MVREETHQKENMIFSSQEYTEKLQKENMTLMKALAHRNKIIELSGIEFQKLKINLRDMQDKNLQIAQANSQMLAELNTNRDRLKALQHELGCKNALLKVGKPHEEQTLPCTHHDSKDKVPANGSNGNCKTFQTHNMNPKDTKRKQMPRIKASGSSGVEPIHVNEKANSKRKVSGVIDTANILEETCQTEDCIEKGVVFQETNQNFDNVASKNFVLDAANSVKDIVHRKRQCTRRQSAKFDVQELEQTEKLLGKDDAKETARVSLRRRSARLRPEEAEVCKSLHEGEEIRETIKRRRITSRKQSAMFDFQEPEVAETLNADDAGSLVSEESTGSRSEAVEPFKSGHDTKETKCRVSTRRQSTKGKSQTGEAMKEIATDPSLRNNVVQKSLVSEEPKAVEPSKSRHDAKETKCSGVSTRRQSTKGKSQTDEAMKEIARDPSLRNNIVPKSLVSEERKAEEPSKRICDTKETNCRVSTRRQSTKGKSQIDETINEIVTDLSLLNNVVQECDHETEAKDKPKVDEKEGMLRRTSVGRPLRHAVEKVESYTEVSLKVKMRRKC